MYRTAFAALCGASLLVAAGCNGQAKREADAAERAQRIPLIAAESQIAADPDRVDVAIFLPDPDLEEDWPQSGARADKAAGHRLAPLDFTVAWKTKAGEGSSKKSTLSAAPVSDGTSVFVIDARQTVSAFNLDDGKLKWRVKLEPPRKTDRIAFGGGLAVAGDTLVVASGYGYVAKLNLADGAQLWKRELSAPVTGSPTVDDEKIFVTTSNNEIYVMQLADGEVLWSDQAIAESARVLSSPSPALGDDLLVTPFSSGELIAYLPANGRRLWSTALTRGGRFTPISAINDIAGSPVLSEGYVFAASQSGVIAGIDQMSGAVKWRQSFGSIRTPAVSGQFVFAVSTDSQVACFDKNDGGVLWVTQLSNFENEKKRKDRIVWGGPVIVSGKLVLASSKGELAVLSPQTGEVMQTVKVKEKVFIEPIVAGGKLILLSDDAKLIAVR